MKITKKQYTNLINFYKEKFDIKIIEGNWETDDFHMNGIFIPDIKSKVDRVFFNEIEIFNIHHSETKTTYHINTTIEDWLNKILNFEFNELEYYKKIKIRFETDELLVYCRTHYKEAEKEYQDICEKVKQLS